MSIRHDKIINWPVPVDAPVVFASLFGISLSICAGNKMSEKEVLTWADKHCPSNFGRWVSVDKSAMGMGGPTPNPCNQIPGRKHWFLFNEINAAQFGFFIGDK